MLILTRYVGQSIRIDNDISIFVMGAKGNSVDMSIKAPIKIPIWREEIYERILKERKEQVMFKNFDRECDLEV